MGLVVTSRAILLLSSWSGKVQNAIYDFLVKFYTIVNVRFLYSDYPRVKMSFNTSTIHN